MVGDIQQKSRFAKESGHQPHPLIDTAVSYVTGFGRDVWRRDLVSPSRMSILGVGVLCGLFAARGLGILLDL